MTPVEAKRAVLLREWSLMVQRRQESGLTISEWCRQNGITESCYYHRLRRVRNSILERSSLMPKANRTLLEAPTIVKVDTSLPMEQSPAPELPSTAEPTPRSFEVPLLYQIRAGYSNRVGTRGWQNDCAKEERRQNNNQQKFINKRDLGAEQRGSSRNMVE